MDSFMASPVVTRELQRLFNTNRDFRALKQLAALTVARIDPATLPESLANPTAVLNPANLFEGAIAQSMSSKAATLLGLSVLELCLVIAMANLSSAHGAALTFECVYEEYRKLVLGGGQKAAEWYSM